MNAASLHAMRDELTKIAGLADRDYVKDHARQAGGYAKKHWGKFKGWFNKQGPVGRSAVIGGLAGGTIGAVRGFAKNDPKINWDTGEFQRPTLKTRAARALGNGVSGAAQGAVMSAGTGYLVGKLTHP